MKHTLALSSLLLLSGLAGHAANPYLPLWEYIPDGEPYVFEDPDNPGRYRVYVYGSHDIERTAYCGRDQVVWSAPVDDLSQWSYGGVIFESKTDALGRPLNPDGRGDILYAPDVTEKTGPDGRKTYYLYPNNQARGRTGMIARSDRPDGPFTVCNWDRKDPTRCEGVLGFDPAVFIDEDGRVYGYWGFQESWGAELDPGINHNPVVNNTAGSIVGYKYFNFSQLRSARARRLLVRLIQQGVKGRIVVMADDPDPANGGRRLGTLRLNGRQTREPVEMRVCVRRARRLSGKHALFFVFESDTPDQSLCELEGFRFF